jgi:hypothetical protein
MKQLLVLLVALALTGCSAFFSTGEEKAETRVPLICSPEHTELPCTAGVEKGVAYAFNLVTHCGIQWAYFDGHYWVPNPMVDAPSDWAGTGAGTMALKRRSVAVFEANEEVTARFVPAPPSYQPPDCE